MYNEVKRFYLFRRRRWADTLFDTLYHVIFILGFYSLLRKILTFSCPISIIISSWPKWFPWAMKSWSTRFGRGNPSAFSMLCNQCIEFTFNELWFTLFGLLCLVYFVWLSLIFWVALLLIHQGLPTHFSLKVISFQGLLVVLIGFLIFLVYYLVMIRLTIRFQRISVLIDFLNTVLLFYSGLVFPVVSFGNLKKLFDGIIRN